MADEFYIPGMPENLQGILYTPRQNPAATKQLRLQHAGDPAMQQRLAVDDRYHQGRGMMQDSPVAALGALLGSVPYDAAKLAYFHGPQPVKRALGNVSERLFPGEGFNDQTTSRPAVDQYKGYVHGMAEGAYGLVRDKVKDLNGRSFSDKAVDRMRAFTSWANSSNPAQSMFEDSAVDASSIDTSSAEAARGSMKAWARRQAAAHAMDPVGTTLKALSAMLQTAVPDADTRQQFDSWKSPGMVAIAPGIKPVQRMSPERKAAHEAEISKILETWPEAKPQGFPKYR